MNVDVEPSTEGQEATATVPHARLVIICGLLLLASAINYMDRQTLAAVSPRITTEFKLSEQQYGNLEASFSWTFAIGSLLFGILADRLSVRWMYPSVLFGWSMIGFLTGFAQDYDQLLWCRGLLGLFESAHWPCALKTTQGLLRSGSRAMGNSVLQSGTSIGAILTPLVMLSIVTPEAGSWRFGFQLVGAVGILWVFAWLFVLRASDFQLPEKSDVNTSWFSAFRDFWSRRFFVILFVVTIINATWQILRAWMPKILMQGYGFTEAQSLLFNSLWFAVTDVGCITVGFIALTLVRRGASIKTARVATFGLCVLGCLSLVLVPMLSKGPLLLCVLLLAGAGALGMFPLYYSFSQDVSRSHQGKVTGVTGCFAWCVLAPIQSGFGWLADTKSSYNTGIVIAGFLPVLAFMALWIFWPNDQKGLSDATKSS